MNRPEHLNCVNSSDGIRRINAEQEEYDKNPEEYERREQYCRDMQQQQEQEDKEFYESFNEGVVYPREDTKNNDKDKSKKVKIEDIPF